jgi:hypothetical protein
LDNLILQGLLVSLVVSLYLPFSLANTKFFLVNKLGLQLDEDFDFLLQLLGVELLDTLQLTYKFFKPLLHRILRLHINLKGLGVSHVVIHFLLAGSEVLNDFLVDHIGHELFDESQVHAMLSGNFPLR